MATVETPQHKHGQNDITVFSTHIGIAQTVVGNGADERDDYVMSGMVQLKSLLNPE